VSLPSSLLIDSVSFSGASGFWIRRIGMGGIFRSLKEEGDEEEEELRVDGEGNGIVFNDDDDEGAS